jgi:hypothetical protein
MPPILFFLGIVALMVILARKARAVGRQANLPSWVVTASLGAAIK